MQRDGGRSVNVESQSEQFPYSKDVTEPVTIHKCFGYRCDSTTARRIIYQIVMTLLVMYCSIACTYLLTETAKEKSSSIMSGWPDALKCTDSSGNVCVLNHVGMRDDYPNDYHQYQMSLLTEDGSYSSYYSWYINFAEDGSYSSDTKTSDCFNKTITELYAEGLAFDLVVL